MSGDMNAALAQVPEGWRLRLEDRGDHWYAVLDFHEFNEEHDFSGNERRSTSGTSSDAAHAVAIAARIARAAPSVECTSGESDDV